MAKRYSIVRRSRSVAIVPTANTGAMARMPSSCTHVKAKKKFVAARARSLIETVPPWFIKRLYDAVVE